MYTVIIISTMLGNVYVLYREDHHKGRAVNKF